MKTKILIYILFVFVITAYSAAQKQGQDLVDSLLTELPKAIDDTNKVNLLYEISYSYNIISPETGIEFAKQGIELAKQLKWKIGEAKNYNALMQNYWAVGDFDLAIDMYSTTVKIEEELGLYKSTPESKLKTINRVFSYPASDFTNLTSEIRNYLREVALFMKENPSVRIAITGHSDDAGTFTQNDSRARERAQKVADFLANSGISRLRLLANGKGALSPIARNDSEDGRRKNRRVEIRAIGL
ncbi:MAG: OmpA family protein [bacterium]